MKHTLGPWKADGPEVCQEVDPRLHIATAWNHNLIEPAEADANAGLIAAAPDLLEAALYFTWAGFKPAEGFRMLKAAIIKAIGEANWQKMNDRIPSRAT